MKDTEFYQHLLGFRAPWFVRRVELDAQAGRVDVYVEHGEGACFACPKCGELRAVYDHTAERVWRHWDTCQYPTFLHARLPRVSCPADGIGQTPAPWTEGSSPFTRLFEGRVIAVLGACDVQAAAALTGLTWDRVWAVVERAVRRGLSRKPSRLPARIGVDEKSFAKRHRYETLVFDLDRGTVEHVADGRSEESLAGYFRRFTPPELDRLTAVVMDMWEPYIQAVRKAVPDAEGKIVFDRYHLMAHVHSAVDRVRRKEHKELLERGVERLKGTRYLWLWNEENVPRERLFECEYLRRLDLKVARAHAMKETLRNLWAYRVYGWAKRFFARGYFWATHSRLSPMIEAARMLKRHLAGVLSDIRHRVTNALAEGINSKIETIKKMACGFRNREHFRTAILFHCGGLDLYPKTHHA
jgi:transposase